MLFCPCFIRLQIDVPALACLVMLLTWNCFCVVSDLKNPPESYNGEVNLQDFWDSVSKELLARGFLRSKYERCLAVANCLSWHIERILYLTVNCQPK